MLCSGLCVLSSVCLVYSGWLLVLMSVEVDVMCFVD